MGSDLWRHPEDGMAQKERLKQERVAARADAVYTERRSCGEEHTGSDRGVVDDSESSQVEDSESMEMQL